MPMQYLCYFTLFCSLRQIRCRELHVENGQLQEELQRMRQHGGGGGGGGGGGQRVRQLQEDNEHLRHQVRMCTCVLLCVYMYVYMRVCLFIVCLFSVYCSHRLLL